MSISEQEFSSVLPYYHLVHFKVSNNSGEQKTIDFACVDPKYSLSYTSTILELLSSMDITLTKREKEKLAKKIEKSLYAISSH